MSLNLDNALRGLQDARTAFFLEGSNPLNTLEQEEALAAMAMMVAEIEDMLGDYE